MNDEAKAKMRKVIEDGFGYPFYDKQSRELTSLNRTFSVAINHVIKDIHDEFIESECGNCEFSCNESHCDKRHNN